MTIVCVLMSSFQWIVERIAYFIYLLVNSSEKRCVLMPNYFIQNYSKNNFIFVSFNNSCGKPNGVMHSDDINIYPIGYMYSNGNGIMKRVLISDGVNTTYAYRQPRMMEHSFTNIPDYSTIPPNEGTTAQVHQPTTTHTR